LHRRRFVCAGPLRLQSTRAPCRAERSSQRARCARAQGCTLLSFAAARRAGLVDAQGVPAGSFGTARCVEVRGVVAGAAERVPTMRIECARPRCVEAARLRCLRYSQASSLARRAVPEQTTSRA
jgi:hypothetical protein